MPNLDCNVGQFWPFPYLAFFSSYRIHFDFAAACGRGPTVGTLHNLGTHPPDAVPYCRSAEIYVIYN